MPSTARISATARSVTFTLTQAEYQRAEAQSTQEDRSLSSLIRVAVKEYCDRAEGASTIQDRTQEHGTAGPWPRNPFDQHGKKA